MTTLMVVALLCVVCFWGANGAIFSDSEDREITELIETTLQCRHIPGMTLAVVKGMYVYVCVYVSYSLVGVFVLILRCFQH